MAQEKVQYIFIYSLLGMVVLGLLCIPAYFTYNHFVWEGYKNDPNKKPLIEKIESIYNKPSKDLTADDYIALGGDYYLLGMFNEAIDAYIKSDEITTSPTAIRNVGNVYKDKKEYKKAEEYYLQSMELDPSDTQIFVDLFELYKLPWSGGKYSPESILELGIGKMGDNSTLLATLANYYKEIGNKAKAIEYYEKTLEFNPSNEAAKQELEVLKNS